MILAPAGLACVIAGQSNPNSTPMHNREARLEMKNLLREAVPTFPVAMTNDLRYGL